VIKVNLLRAKIKRRSALKVIHEDCVRCSGSQKQVKGCKTKTCNKWGYRLAVDPYRKRRGIVQRDKTGKIISSNKGINPPKKAIVVAGSGSIIPEDKNTKIRQGGDFVTRKLWGIDYRACPGWYDRTWHHWKSYRTERQRDQALAVLRIKNYYGIATDDYRKCQCRGTKVRRRE
jgi:hypothetical protein